MTRPIKFRGRDMTGHFVYGLLTKKRIRSSGEVVFAIALSEKQSENIPVNENSIAQLVGFDRDGREVYEGDILLDELEQEYTAEIYDRPEKIHALKLKEAQP